MTDINKNKLIVNYLPQCLTDIEFKSMFEDIGDVKMCKIVRDRNSGYSFGFGFVEYVNDCDASKAIQRLNGKQLLNKVIKVAYSRQGEKIKGANLYVRNVSRSWSEKDLENVFSPYGAIIQSRILRDQTTGSSKGVGFVLFNTRDQAEMAMNALNGTVPEGSTTTLQVNFADERSKLSQQKQSSYSNVLTGYGGNEEDFSGIAEYSIPLVNPLARETSGMKVLRHRGRGGGGPLRIPASRVRYNPVSSAMMYVPTSIPVANSALASQGYVLYAYNIGSKTTQEELSELFSLYGTVSKVDVIWDHQKNMGKGYGFITMPSYEEAANAIQCLNGYSYAGKPLQVSFKTPKL